MTEPLLTADDLGALIHKSAEWVKDRAYAKAIPSTKVGRSYLFTEAQRDEIIAGFERPALRSVTAETSKGLTSRARRTG